MDERQLGQIGRRGLLHGSLGLTLAGCAAAPSASLEGPPLVPIRARTDRIIDVSVCLRPFRAAGPRVETERLGDTLVVHNYGHGGSGWSLSWGSSARAVTLAMQPSPRDIAVIGCGALGLTSARLAQRAGARVTIYARDQIPLTTSAGATGEWTPDSRVADAGAVSPSFADTWEEMARASFRMHRENLGLPGTPVEWIDTYSVTDTAQTAALSAESVAEACAVQFARYVRRIGDLTPFCLKVPIEATPFRGSE